MEEFWIPDAPPLGYDNVAFPFFALAWIALAASGLCMAEVIAHKWRTNSVAKFIRIGKEFLQGKFTKCSSSRG